MFHNCQSGVRITSHNRLVSLIETPQLFLLTRNLSKQSNIHSNRQQHFNSHINIRAVQLSIWFRFSRWIEGKTEQMKHSPSAYSITFYFHWIGSKSQKWFLCCLRTGWWACLKAWHSSKNVPLKAFSENFHLHCWIVKSQSKIRGVLHSLSIIACLC